MSADKVVRIIVLGSTSDAEAKMVALGATTDEVAAGMSGSIGSMTSKSGGLISKLGNKMQALGIPFSGTLTKVGDKLDQTSTKGQHFAQAMSTMGGTVLLASGVAAAGVAAASIKMGMDYQTTEADIATYAGTTQKKADLIGKAMLGTAFKTQYSANTIGQAFASTAGQFAAVEGHALNVKQSMDVMSASTNLAEATQKDLGSATSALGKIMQGFTLPITSANMIANVLYNTSRKLGIGMGQVATQVTRMRARMGALGPTLQQMGGLLVDLTAHGQTGRMAMRALGSTINKLIQPSTTYLNSLQKQKVTLAGIPAQYQGLAKEMAAGTITTKEFQMATQYTSEAVKTQIDAYKSQVDASITSREAMTETGITAFNAAGKFVGFGSVIAQLNAKMRGQTQEQKLATLSLALGTQASVKLLNTIQAGPAAYRKYTEEVQRKNSAEKAAQLQEATLQHQLDQLKAGLEDYGVKIGQFLIPKLKSLATHVVDLVKWFQKHKDVAIALAGVITTVLGVAVGFFIESKLVKFGKFMKSGVQDIMKFGQACQKIVAKILGMGQAQTVASDEVVAGQAEVSEGAVVMGTTVETEAEGMNLALSVGPLIAIVAIGVAVMELVKHWRGAWTAIKEAFHLAWDGIKDVFRGALNFIEHGGFVMFGPMIIGLVELVKHWRGAWTAVKDVVKGVWDFIKNIFDQITKGFDNLRHGIATVANDLSHPWKILGLAGGGTAMAGHTYMVGEQGPELFTPGTTGTITPHNSSKGAGGATINITGYNLADPSQTAAEIAWKLKTSPSGTT